MGQSYYAQSDWAQPPTLTVKQLIEKLQACDPDAAVIFKSPNFGSFGPLSAYTIESVETVCMPRWERNIEACTDVDDETGETITREAEVQVFHEWNGVVIS